ncbi:MAG: alanine racemase [Cyclobacteriaceae bacterium]
MNSPSYIELDKGALKNNYRFIHSLLAKGVRMSSVVKGNAYGHGIAEFVPLAESLGISHFSVHSADEAKRVLDAKQKDATEVMIMGYIDDDNLEWAVSNGISFFVFEYDRLLKAAEAAETLGKRAKVHIELETGMNRTGFQQEDLDLLISLIKGNLSFITFEGLCTHFAGAESVSNLSRVQAQARAFNQMADYIESHGLKPQIKHTCCSAATLRLPEMHFDLVRIGILQYGFWPTKETFIGYIIDNKNNDDPLKRALSWKSRVMTTKTVKMGEFIGYGTTYLAQRDMKIAVVPIGYSHGFSRSLSNQGRVLIHGYRLSVIGMVNMNNMAVDITEVPHVSKGDTVTLIGYDGELEVSVASFAELSDQLNYELLTRLPFSIPRKVI